MDVFEDFEDIDDREIVDLINVVNPERHPYTIRERTNHFVKWDEKEFLRRFRLSKLSVLQLLNEIEPQLRHHSDRNRPISPQNQLLLTLKFLASGCFYIAAGDFLGIHKSTAAKIIARVIKAILELRGRYIKFPQSLQEKQESVRQFAMFARFPRTIGAIDCTHIRLLSPGGENAEAFRNRKGFMSLNIQVICDAETKIVDVVARWPGSAHDSHIFSNSTVRMKFENGSMGNFLLVGDSGYPVKPYLMTPLGNPRTAAENLYNESQIRTRNVIERTFGILKRRFPILSTGLRCKLQLAQQIVTATAILHNIAVAQHDDIPDDDFEDQPNDIDFPVQPQADQENIVRQSIISYFQTLL